MLIDIITIIKRFIINNDIYFNAKIYNKNVFIVRNIIIIKLFCNENIIIARSFCDEDNEDNENAILLSYNDIISASYSHIKFIILFKYLTLY